MSPAVKLIVLLACSPLMIFLIHISISRLIRNYSPQIVVIIAAFIGEILMASSLWYLVFRALSASMSGVVFAIFYSLVIYNALAYTYFHLFNMSETARRIRILYEIDRKGSLPESEIISMYGTDDILDIRLKRLIDTKQLVCIDGRYLLNSRLLYYTALLVAGWRRILGFQKLHSELGDKVNK